MQAALERGSMTVDSTNLQNPLRNGLAGKALRHPSQSEPSQHRRYDRLTDSLTPGLLIVAIGSIALVHQLQWISTDNLWKLWPVALILAGISELESWWRVQR
jgi:hypothetical protein